MKKLFCNKKLEQNGNNKKETIQSKSIIIVTFTIVVINHTIQLVNADRLFKTNLSYKDNDPNSNYYEKKFFNGSGLAGFLLTDSTDSKLDLSNELDLKLSNILDRTGPDMRPSSDFTDFDDITIDISKRAWKLMHNHAEKLLLDKLKIVEPILKETLMLSNVSSNCYEAVIKTITAAKTLDSWAIQCKLFCCYIIAQINTFSLVYVCYCFEKTKPTN